MGLGLSPKQQQLLDYLTSRIAREGSAPSLRQAAAALGVSHTAVAQLIRVLEDKGRIRRDGRYGRNIRLLDREGRTMANSGREVPIIGTVRAGVPMYAQQDWDGCVVVDRTRFRGENLFALRIQGDSMQEAGILANDLVICEARQYAENGEIVVALIENEEATVKRFFLRADHIELRPENRAYPPMRYGLGEVLIQGKVIGLIRDQGF